MNALTALLKRPLLQVAGFSLCINLLMLIPAIFMLQVFDRVLVSRSIDTLLVLMAGAGAGLLLMFGLDQIRVRLQATVGQMVGESLAPAVTRILIAHGARREGRVSQEGLRDVNALRALFSAQGLLALFDAPWLVVYVAIIWAAHPWLGVTAVAAAVLMLAMAVLNDALTRPGLEVQQRASSGATRFLEASLAHADVAHALGMTDALIARWQQRCAELARLQGPVARRLAIVAAATRMLRQSVQVVMLSVGAWLVITGRASPGVTIACTILLGRALAPVEQVVGSWKVLAEARLALERLRALFEAAAAEPAPMDLPEPTGRLCAEGLTLRVPTAERVLLSNVSLNLAPGESLAIVGASGAGKSTLLRLLVGVSIPTSGVARLDGFDLSRWRRDQLGQWLGYVPQAVELFSGTVADNIARLGVPDPRKVVEAAQRARVHAMIQALPQGYDTWVEPGGGLLSPGQRQRIALARALYGSPRLLLLDEPNSNLDGQGELALAEALAALRGIVTVVVVTHRTSLIQQLDKLLVLDEGQVQSYGPAATVLNGYRQHVPAKAAGGSNVVAMAAVSAERGDAELGAR